MKDHAKKLIAATAQVLAGRAHTSEEMYAVLYQLALDIVSPARGTLPFSLRRTPLANEVLPRHQRASWARGKTVYDVDEG